MFCEDDVNVMKYDASRVDDELSPLKFFSVNILYRNSVTL